MDAPTPAMEKNIRCNVRHGVASVLAQNLAAPFLGIFALKLGASNWQVGLLSSAPALVSLAVMIPGAIYVDRFTRKKEITSRFFLANRVFYLALACLPFLTPDWRAWALVATVALMNLPGAIGNVAWQSFISRVIPPERRAQAFARRNRAMNIVGTAAVVVAGRLLDVISFPVGYQVMLVLAFAVALLELRIFREIEEPEGPVPGALGSRPTPPPNGAGAASEPVRQAGNNGRRVRRRIIHLRGSLREAAADVLAHPRFIRFTVASAVFYFMWQIAWPLFTLYQVKELGANNFWISLLHLCNTGGALVGYGFWARFADRYGHLRTLTLSTLGIFIVPLYYGFSESLLTITLLNLVTGAIFSGVNLSLFNALLEQTPEEHKTTYIAYYNTAITLTSVFAPIVGVSLLNGLGFFWSFMLCAAGRLVGSLAFALVHRAEQREAAPPAPVVNTASLAS